MAFTVTQQHAGSCHGFDVRPRLDATLSEIRARSAVYAFHPSLRQGRHEGQASSSTKSKAKLEASSHRTSSPPQLSSFSPFNHLSIHLLRADRRHSHILAGDRVTHSPLTMLPLGVVAYSTAANSASPSKAESPFRKLRKQAKANSVQIPADQLPRFSEDSTAASQSPRGADPLSQGIAEPDNPQFSSRFIATDHSLSLPLTKPRPKHCPIVIPRYWESLTPENSSPLIDASTPSGTPPTTSSTCPSLSEFPPGSASRRPSRLSTSSTEPDSPRPRYVEIKIPAWAHPIEFLPHSPISLPSPISSSDPQYSVSPSSQTSPLTMARPMVPGSRTSTMDSATAAPSAAQLGGPGNFMSSVNSSQTSLNRWNPAASEAEIIGNAGRAAGSAYQGTGPSPNTTQTATLTYPQNSGLSGLVCNVHRTTGKEPRPLVGATTTIVGDKLYVFGGRRLSRTRPQLTSDLFELDLIHRNWTKLETQGDLPPPRYFHSVCALGDTKLVCYGGMSPAVLPNGQPTIPNQPVNPQEPQPEVVVMSDIHIYDIPSRTWLKVQSVDSPQGRYAHCASILPSSSVFASTTAPLSALHHNASSSNAPNTGQIGITVDGSGGAEMVVVGGQDSANHYIEQISVFNLRSLRWTSTTTLGRSCGAYRSVTASLSSSLASQIGEGEEKESDKPGEKKEMPPDGGSAMLIYSNYNFLDVKLELQVRLQDGTLVEKQMLGAYSPPGLRFPNGGVLDNHFVVSGTFLTSSKQEYALWALNLRTLTWSRIDAGGATFTQGSWNRGVLWNRRNTFVILGNRKRSLVEDYNHRRINFSNICMVELEAFGLYDNPRRGSPTSGYLSASAPKNIIQPDPFAGGRQLSKAAEELGTVAMSINELCDMEFLAMNGERIPANSRLIARRWGPYFNQLLREGLANVDNDTATLRPTNSIISVPSRNSSLTITPSVRSQYSGTSTLINKHGSDGSPANVVTPQASYKENASEPLESRSSADPNPSLRPRTLYLPHTPLTIQALLYYLYTSSLPPPTSKLCTPQILCSLLQLARPYKVDGLLEAVVERLHGVLDNRNTAAIFNAAAMAAGGGSGVRFFSDTGSDSAGTRPKAVNGAGGPPHSPTSPTAPQPSSAPSSPTLATPADAPRRPLRINTDVAARRPRAASPGGGPPSDDESSAGASGGPSSSSGRPSASASAADLPALRRAPPSDDASRSETSSAHDPWRGGVSAVVGLQKRGLRGLMEGRRIREMGGEPGAPLGSAGAAAATQQLQVQLQVQAQMQAQAQAEAGRVGLGIA